MAKDVIMPVLGMAQDSGVVVSWLKQPGEFVREGEPLLEVETDKAVVEVPAMASGVLADVTASAGAEVPTGTVIARLIEEGEDPGRAPQAGPPTAAPSADKAGSAPTITETPPAAASGVVSGRTGAPAQVKRSSRPAEVAKGGAIPSAGGTVAVGGTARGGNGRLLASPKAKRLSRELGLDLRSIRGSGPDGAVRARDLAAALSRSPVSGPVPAGSWLKRVVRLEPLRGLEAEGNAYLRRSRQDTTISVADVLARLTVAAFSASGNPVPADILVIRDDGSGHQEACRIRDALSSAIVGSAGDWDGHTGAADAAVQVLDLSGSPFESPLPPMPATCKLRVTLASTTGSGGGTGTLTLEHDADPGVVPAALMTRLVELLEDPVAALLYV